MRQRHRDMRVEQAHRRIQLEERQRKDGGRRHAVGQQPEEQVLVAHEVIAAEGIGRRQRHGHGDHRVHHHVDQAVHITHVPGRIGQDGRVIGKGQVPGPQAEGAGDLGIGLQAHVDQPVDRQHQEQKIEDHDDGAAVDALAHALSPFCPDWS